MNIVKKHSGSCNTRDDLSSRVCIPNDLDLGHIINRQYGDIRKK